VATARASLQGTGGDGMHAGAALEWTRPFGDQSNCVGLASGRYVLKLFRRIEPRVNPEFELGRFLANRGFSRVPELVGALEYQRPRLEPGTLAGIQTAGTHHGSAGE